MTWTSDHKNKLTLKNLMGVALHTPSYFPTLIKMVIFGHFHKTEPRDRIGKNPTFYFKGFMV